MTMDDGFNSGFRNLGRFFLALIPWALGIGALVWLGVWIGVHTYYQQVQQENRRAQFTGVASPKSKIKIQVENKSCVRVQHVDVDGDMLTIDARNDCPSPLYMGYLEYHWQQMSPNGTVIHQNYSNDCPVPLERGDTAECIFSDDHFDPLSDDDRVATVRVWTDTR